MYKRQGYNGLLEEFARVGTLGAHGFTAVSYTHLLQQEIRERDAESLDQLSDSVIDALENRYQAMLDGEIDRLEQSRDVYKRQVEDARAVLGEEAQEE